MILRPGPYINAEVDAGGFPGWLTATKGRARTSAPTYLTYVDEWLTAVNRIVVRHQYTAGSGTVVLYQLENEYADHVTEAAGRDYMAHLYRKVRATASTCRSSTTTRAGTATGRPAPSTPAVRAGTGSMPSTATPRRSGPAGRGYFGPGGTKGGASASPGTPGFLAEFGAAGSIPGVEPSSTARGTPSRAVPGTRRTSGAST